MATKQPAGDPTGFVPYDVWSKPLPLYELGSNTIKYTPQPKPLMPDWLTTADSTSSTSWSPWITPNLTLNDLIKQAEELKKSNALAEQAAKEWADSQQKKNAAKDNANCCARCGEDAGMAQVMMTEKGIMLFMVCSECEYEWFMVITGCYRAESTGGSDPKPMIPGGMLKPKPVKKIEKAVDVPPMPEAKPVVKPGHRKIDMS